MFWTSRDPRHTTLALEPPDSRLPGRPKCILSTPQRCKPRPRGSPKLASSLQRSETQRPPRFPSRAHPLPKALSHAPRRVQSVCPFPNILIQGPPKVPKCAIPPQPLEPRRQWSPKLATPSQSSWPRPRGGFLSARPRSLAPSHRPPAGVHRPPVCVRKCALRCELLV